MAPSFHCGDCYEVFSSYNDLLQHRGIRAEDSSPRWHHYGSCSRQPHAGNSRNSRPFISEFAMDLINASLRGVSSPPTATTSQTPSHRCNACGRAFQTDSRLSAHRGGDLNTADRFSCDAQGCSFASCSASGLQSHRQSLRHVSAVHAEVDEPIEEPTSPSSQEIREMFDEDTFDGDMFGGLVTCNQCSELVWESNLEGHHAVYHPTVRCLHCNEQFGNADDLEVHHANGVSLREVPKIEVECPCGVSFPDRLVAVRHINADREHPKHFGFCFHCEVSFEDISDYLCHNERLHDSLYPPNFLSETSRAGRATPSSTAISRTNAGKRKQDTGERKVALTCIICLSFPEKLTATSCGHLYCNECIISCLRAKPECPACRTKTTLAGLREIFI